MNEARGMVRKVGLVVAALGAAVMAMAARAPEAGAADMCAAMPLGGVLKTPKQSELPPACRCGVTVPRNFALRYTDASRAQCDIFRPDGRATGWCRNDTVCPQVPGGAVSIERRSSGGAWACTVTWPGEAVRSCPLQVPYGVSSVRSTADLGGRQLVQDRAVLERRGSDEADTTCLADGSTGTNWLKVTGPNIALTSSVTLDGGGVRIEQSFGLGSDVCVAPNCILLYVPSLPHSYPLGTGHSLRFTARGAPTLTVPVEITEASWVRKNPCVSGRMPPRLSGRSTVAPPAQATSGSGYAVKSCATNVDPALVRTQGLDVPSAGARVELQLYYTTNSNECAPSSGPVTVRLNGPGGSQSVTFVLGQKVNDARWLAGGHWEIDPSSLPEGLTVVARF